MSTINCFGFANIYSRIPSKFHKKLGLNHRRRCLGMKLFPPFSEVFPSTAGQLGKALAIKQNWRVLNQFAICH